MSTPSTRDTILAHRTTVREVRAFDAQIFVREMRAAEVASFQRFLTQHEDRTDVDVQCELLARTICDEQGERLFGDDEAGRLAELPMSDLRRAYKVAEALNTVTEDDVKAAEGNSEATPSSTCASASPEHSD